MDDPQQTLFGLMAITKNQQQSLQNALDQLDQRLADLKRSATRLENSGPQVAQQARDALRDGLEQAVQSTQKHLSQPLLAGAAELRDAAENFSWRAILMIIAVILLMGLILLAGMLVLVPSPGEIQALRIEKAQLEAHIKVLTEKGAKIHLTYCTPNGSQKRRLCAELDERYGRFGDKGELFMILKGY